MNLRWTLPILAGALLLPTAPAAADWIDYTDEGFSARALQSTLPACDPFTGCPDRDEVGYIIPMDHTEGERVGFVFVHGMGADCEPDMAPPGSDLEPYEMLGLRLVSEEESEDRTYAIGGSLESRYGFGPAKGRKWLMRPANTGRSCEGLHYWGPHMLRQITNVGPLGEDSLGQRPTLVVGYNGKEDWAQDGGHGPARDVVARQIASFIDAFTLDRVVIIAHSMGGVVVRDLFSAANVQPSAEELAAGPSLLYNPHYAAHLVASKTSRVITLASPQTGSYASDAASLIEDTLNSASDTADFVIDLIRGGFLQPVADAAGQVPLIGDGIEAVLELGMEILTGFVRLSLLELVDTDEPWGTMVLGMLGYDHDAVRSLETARMARSNQRRLGGRSDRPGLNVEWLNAHGTLDSNWVMEHDLDPIEVRNRFLVCREELGWTYWEWISMDPADWLGKGDLYTYGCGEDVGLLVVGALVDSVGLMRGRVENTDGMVHSSSARLIGANIMSSKSNHHHIRMGDISYSWSKLDLIGHLRYYAHADGDPNPRFAAMVDRYLPPGEPVELLPPPPPPTLEPAPPQLVRPRVEEGALDCTTTGVAGTRGNFVSHTGRFDLLMEQPYLPGADTGPIGWPERYEVRIVKTSRPYLPGPDGIIAGPTTVEERSMTFDAPMNAPGAGGVFDVTLPIDLRRFPIDLDLTWRTLSGMAGSYALSVRGCNDTGCSAFAQVPEAYTITMELSEAVEPMDFENVFVCSESVIGGRLPLSMPVFGPSVSKEVLKEFEGQAGYGLDVPNSYEHVDEPMLPRPPLD